MKIEIKPEYFIIKYLWLLILLPKELQFICFLGIMFYLFIHNNIKKVDITYVCFLFSFFIHIISIILNFSDYENDRVLAAINTAGIMFIAINLYNIYRQMDLDLEKIYRYVRNNILIFCILGIIFIISKYFNIRFINVFERSIAISDWLNESLTYRFTALMEYSNLVVMFYILTFTILSEYFIKNKNYIKFFLFFPFFCYCASLSNSRMGILLILTSYLILIFYNVLGYKLFNYLGIIFILAIIIFGYINYEHIDNYIEKTYNARLGSSDARSFVYSESIRITLENSPFIGVGIKDLTFGVPLGSHSSYIGYFYKTGFIGFITTVLGFLIILKNNLQKYFYFKNIYPLLFTITMYIFMVVEDLDGTNWPICLFFVLQGIYMNSAYKN